MYLLRMMRVEDVPQVVSIDQLSFGMPWSARSYHFEISDNPNAHMFTLTHTDAIDPLLNGVDHVLGYGGMWLIEGEAHISTIAVHPDYRGRGLGEVILVGMIGRALERHADYAVLEVRVSNTAALNLYQKYEFTTVGRRKNYYRDTHEDAFLMHLAPLDQAYQSRFQSRLEALRARLSFIDALF